MEAELEYAELDFDNPESIDMRWFSEYELDEWKPGDPVNSRNLQNLLSSARRYM